MKRLSPAALLLLSVAMAFAKVKDSNMTVDAPIDEPDVSPPDINATADVDGGSSTSLEPSTSPSFQDTSTATPSSDVASSTPSFVPSNAPTSTSTTNSSRTPSHAPSSHPTKRPIKATPRPTYSTLPLQSINILVLTDVHSWVQGHGSHEPNLNADYGDVLSFYQRLHSQITSFAIQEDGSTPDLYFVMNGDFVHGTILGDDPPRYLSGIVERMPYDVVTIGNHELLSLETVKLLREAGGLVDSWGESLVTSNVRVKDDSGNGGGLVPMGSNYRFLNGNQGTVLAFGFLFNMGSEAVVTVETVQDVIQQPWFTSLFASPRPTDFDAILVLAHMDVQDDLILLLHTTFRELCGDSMVIQFITGHTHTRSYNDLDEYASSFEAGRYLDTVGFVSFDPRKGNFEHVFVDANKASIAQSLGMGIEEYPTQDGKELTEYIARTLNHAGANEILGCAPNRFRVEGYLNETDSLLRLYMEEVMPSTFLHQSSTGGSYYEHVFMQRLDWFVRYDLFEGVVTMNDVAGVVPEDDTIVSISYSIHGKDILELMDVWNNQSLMLGNTTNVVGIATEDSVGLQNPHSAIENTTKYKLYSLANTASSLLDIMADLGITTSTASSAQSHSDKSMRSMWVDFVRDNWPYDGNDCKCLIDRSCGNYSTPGISNSGGEMGSFYDSNIKPSSSFSSTTSSHGTQHVSMPGSPNPPISESKQTPHQSSGHTSQSSYGSTEKSYANSAGMAKLWVAVVVIGMLSFMLFRSRRQGYAAARDVSLSNDLELQVVPPPGYGDMNTGGYSSPQVSSRGRFV
jgi:2',3'-cyclic-nucleotide 2'-phosphodiesterase (5'-nucleotidase family)